MNVQICCESKNMIFGIILYHLLISFVDIGKDVAVWSSTVVTKTICKMLPVLFML